MINCSWFSYFQWLYECRYCPRDIVFSKLNSSGGGIIEGCESESFQTRVLMVLEEHVFAMACAKISFCHGLRRYSNCVAFAIFTECIKIDY